MAQRHGRTEAPQQDDGAFKAYEEYAKTLRAWFVAFGIGGATLLVTTGSLKTDLRNAGVFNIVAYSFVFGIGAQILLAAVNKYANYSVYFLSDLKEAQREPYPILRLFQEISTWYMFDMVLDLLTMTSFAIASCLILKVIA